MEKSHLHVGLPLWFLTLDLDQFEQWMCCEEYMQCFTARSKQIVYISQSFPGS